MAQSNQDLSKLNRQGSLYAATITCTVLAIIAVVARLCARWKSAFKYGIDDILIVLSLCALLAFTVGHLVVTAYGYGRPMIYVKNMHTFVSATVSNIVAYAVGTTLTKLSILCFYSRMFHSKRLNRVNWAMGIFVVLYNIALILVTALECIPLSTMWTGKPGHCINTSPAFLTLGVINFVTDIAIVCIPIRFVLRLQMTKFRKFQVLGVFMTGAVVCACGIVRVATLAGLSPDDPSYNMALPGVWSFAEEAIGIVGACLPTLSGFITKQGFKSITSSVQALLPSSRRRSPMGTSILNSAYCDGQGSTQASEGKRQIAEMDRLSGETVHSSASIHQVPTNPKDDHMAPV